MDIFEVKNLNYHVGDKKILSNINLKIADQSFNVITGPSGSGKSTLLKLFGYLISPTSGDIEYKNESLNHVVPSKYRQEVSYCFQSPVLFGKTVRDNLSFPYEIRQIPFDEKRANELLDSVGLQGFMDKEVNDISGGEKQRVALIRNVMFVPNVLLLDEITSSLDAEKKAIIWDFIEKIHREEHVTIISVSHQQEEIDNATNLIRIVDGKVVA